ncbi:hypothetical protein P691DRAFT_810265 [Macrolepiota fuliginosa MF-IS2]|uniref:Uncharacterized protein n=1 Tax=Macrolepiota fuliginosa MF-IS2 TaxID=1400762 RepID=A0A9P5X3P8_9AGAR|nr:hypothetical protein P691DRAFT_810265 [Macrolepiota fuliginosa MF-IS2]
MTLLRLPPVGQVTVLRPLEMTIPLFLVLSPYHRALPRPRNLCLPPLPNNLLLRLPPLPPNLPPLPPLPPLLLARLHLLRPLLASWVVLVVC